MANNDSIQKLWNAITAIRRDLDQLEAGLVSVIQDAALGQTVRDAIQRDTSSKRPAATVVSKAEIAPPRQQPVIHKVKVKGRRRTPAANTVEKILSALESKPNGLSSKELTAATGIDAGALGYRLNTLRNEKKVRMQGTRGQARYFLAS